MCIELDSLPLSKKEAKTTLLAVKIKYYIQCAGFVDLQCNRNEALVIDLLSLYLQFGFCQLLQ